MDVEADALEDGNDVRNKEVAVLEIGQHPQISQKTEQEIGFFLAWVGLHTQAHLIVQYGGAVEQDQEPGVNPAIKNSATENQKYVLSTTFLYEPVHCQNNDKEPQKLEVYKIHLRLQRGRGKQRIRVTTL